jgi:hypothetical protein
MLSPVHLIGWSQLANLIAHVTVKRTKENDKDEYKHSKSLTKYTSLTGHAVAQFFEALRYKPEGRGFNPRCCHWNFSLT